jgi:hypothetical protein
MLGDFLPIGLLVKGHYIYIHLVLGDCYEVAQKVDIFVQLFTFSPK